MFLLVCLLQEQTLDSQGIFKVILKNCSTQNIYSYVSKGLKTQNILQF